VTVLVSGSAAGIVGPVVIIAEGDKVSAGFETSAALAPIGAPAGSFVVANASAYMTVATMENIIERFCVALRESDPVVAQHPTFWITLYADQCLAHCKSQKVMATLLQHRIRIVFEEAQSSHAVQVFDGEPALVLKRSIRASLTTARHIASIVSRRDQWWYITVVCTAFQLSGPALGAAFSHEFVRRNLHPSRRIPVHEWIRRSSRLQAMVVAAVALVGTEQPLHVQARNQVGASMPDWYRGLSSVQQEGLSSFFDGVIWQASGGGEINTPDVAKQLAALLLKNGLTQQEFQQYVTFKLAHFMNDEWIAAAERNVGGPAAAAVTAATTSAAQLQCGDLSSSLYNPPTMSKKDNPLRFQHMVQVHARHDAAGEVQKPMFWAVKSGSTIGAFDLEVAPFQV